jgi:putative membrane protein
MFFGLYEPMLNGISSFSLSVIIPLAIGLVLCLILISRAVNKMYEKWHSQVSHTIIGVVIASMIMVIPFESLNSPYAMAIAIISVAAGACASFLIGKLCDKLT